MSFGLVVLVGLTNFMVMRDDEWMQTRTVNCVFHANNQNVRVEKQSGVDTTKGRLLLLRVWILRNSLFKAVWCVSFKPNAVRWFV